MKSLSLLVVLALLSSLLTATDLSIVVIGEISDSQCAFNIHSSDGSHDAMIKTHTLGENAEECTRTCVLIGGKYILVDTVNHKLYHLANPAVAADFAAQQVCVRGVLYGKGVLVITTIKARHAGTQCR
jgi:hypothetical protein